MKATLFLVPMMLTSALAVAQTPLTASDPDLVTLTTPLVLDKGAGLGSVEFRGFGGDDGLFRTGVAAGYGLGDGWEIRLAGDFAKVAYDSTGSIRYGGSDGEFLVKYGIPGMAAASIEAGESYSNTPAQPGRLSTVLGVSVGTAATKGVRLYANPKVVFLDRNSLFGLGLGAAIDLAPGVTLVGDWTPILSGENTLNASTAARERVQIYGVALRFAKVTPGLGLDLGYTNSTGQTTGFALTPGLGNSGAFYVRLTSRF